MTALLGTQKLEANDGWQFNVPHRYVPPISINHMWHRTLSAEEIADISGKMARGEMADCDCAICTGEVKLV